MHACDNLDPQIRNPGTSAKKFGEISWILHGAFPTPQKDRKFYAHDSFLEITKKRDMISKFSLNSF